MKTLLITIVSALTLGATLPALAGADFQAIDQAQKAQQAPQAEGRGNAIESKQPTAAGQQKCAPSALVLPLDHGPRAQTTPYLNQLRKDRYAAQVQACKDAAK